MIEARSIRLDLIPSEDARDFGHITSCFVINEEIFWPGRGYANVNLTIREMAQNFRHLFLPIQTRYFDDAYSIRLDDLGDERIRTEFRHAGLTEIDVACGKAAFRRGVIEVLDRFDDFDRERRSA